MSKMDLLTITIPQKDCNLQFNDIDTFRCKWGLLFANKKLCKYLNRIYRRGDKRHIKNNIVYDIVSGTLTVTVVGFPEDHVSVEALTEEIKVFLQMFFFNYF